MLIKLLSQLHCNLRTRTSQTDTMKKSYPGAQISQDLIVTMSAILRLGAFQATGQLAGLRLAIALPLLPRLPTVSQLLPQWASSLNRQVEADSRLQELKELLEKNGEPPFMFDNGSILKAAPKKKPSYKRRREKRLSPGDKQIQPLENLGRCAACGRVKRSHFMCMHCFGEIRTFLKEKKKQLFGEPAQYEPDMDKVDKELIFPTKRETDLELIYKKRPYVPVREKPLQYDRKDVKKQ